jgi:hypothetical protein
MDYEFEGNAMVFAVQCPEPKCRKFMLVEEHDRGKVVPCLICKTPIRVGGQESGVKSQESGVRSQQTESGEDGLFDM